MVPAGMGLWARRPSERNRRLQVVVLPHADVLGVGQQVEGDLVGDLLRTYNLAQILDITRHKGLQVGFEVSCALNLLLDEVEELAKKVVVPWIQSGCCTTKPFQKQPKTVTMFYCAI